MSKPYEPSAAFGAEIKKDAEAWTLVLVRDLNHPPEKVWTAITEPEHLREWAPFDADTSLSKVGTVAKLTTVGAPKPHVTETQVKRAEAPKLLEFSWGDQNIRWELEPKGAGTRLTIWHNINRNYISMGAAGWHICIDVMDAHLAGEPIGRTVGPAAMKVAGWPRLLGEYVKLLGVEAPKW
ncbi:MAG: SRPBCC family protein [Deltaproteobacteria bacterium]|nr:SRPBCC family protein [Deltaproteobacteria bacterium]